MRGASLLQRHLMQFSRQDALWDFVVSIAVMTHARLRGLAPEHRGPIV